MFLFFNSDFKTTSFYMVLIKQYLVLFYFRDKLLGKWAWWQLYVDCSIVNKNPQDQNQELIVLMSSYVTYIEDSLECS